MALIKEAERKGIPRGRIVQGSGYSLPFKDDSVDAVLECGVLHHVADPFRVVEEMTRVARRPPIGDAEILIESGRQADT